MSAVLFRCDASLSMADSALLFLTAAFQLDESRIVARPIVPLGEGDEHTRSRAQREHGPL